jgi:hypothetical protein
MEPSSLQIALGKMSTQGHLLIGGRVGCSVHLYMNTHDRQSGLFFGNGHKEQKQGFLTHCPREFATLSN